MKFFTNKSIWSKIVIALVIVLVFQFIVAKPSLGVDQSDAIEFGGKLLSPIVSLGVTLADAIQEIMQSSIMGTSNSLMHINTDSAWYDGFKWVLTAVIVAAARNCTFLYSRNIYFFSYCNNCINQCKISIYAWKKGSRCIS